MVINVRVKPRSKKNEIVKLDGENYQVRLTVPPVNDRANQALISMLADYFDVSKSAVRIVKGLHSKNKVIEISQP